MRRGGRYFYDPVPNETDGWYALIDTVLLISIMVHFNYDDRLRHRRTTYPRFNCVYAKQSELELIGGVASGCLCSRLV